ncbi:hypothetical protein ACPW96_15695 [Micromonospora sp. DT81.3]|uniref:hypothetical protein n=1 Tax=Micromonospora sp. DT81.3 TaxID=3416523 RepID=UPI003CEAF4ED
MRRPTGSGHAFRWTPSAGMRDLGTLGGGDSSPAAIDIRGQVTGNAETTRSGPLPSFRPGEHTGRNQHLSR